ncbi:putative F-box/LRR-repeat protein At5g02700 [Vicia villosa]|uniref:putative F-box/LRR-repeat protein At5g02700 n=1 Tax=Vicia villosa TaxID=3911 RepID=UPI00273B9713|nr:putative F-box/LRR-repeat protein At5g02700 [Vicia villosa]
MTELNDLPDSLIHHILSFLNTKTAVQTSLLSQRWNHLWKQLHTLTLHSSHFQTLDVIFISRVLFLRDSSIPLHSLDFDQNASTNPYLLNKIVSYAISQNVQRLSLSSSQHIAQFPPIIFSSQTLTYLKLISLNKNFGKQILFPKSLNLPALTTLHIHNFSFCIADHDYADPFSALSRLNTLVISSCTLVGTMMLWVSSTTVNLTVHNNSPKYFDIKLCTPSLCTYAFTGTPMPYFSANSFSSVKHVDIDAELFLDYRDPILFRCCLVQVPLILHHWLLQFSDVTSLTVSATTLQVISLCPNVLKSNHYVLRKLKILKVKTKPLDCEFCMSLLEAKLLKIDSEEDKDKLRKAFQVALEPSSPIPDGIVDFLIQNSPLAQVEIIDCSEEKPHSTS